MTVMLKIEIKKFIRCPTCSHMNQGGNEGPVHVGRPTPEPRVMDVAPPLVRRELVELYRPVLVHRDEVPDRVQPLPRLVDPVHLRQGLPGHTTRQQAAAGVGEDEPQRERRLQPRTEPVDRYQYHEA